MSTDLEDTPIIMIEIRASGYRLSGPPSTAKELGDIALLLGAGGDQPQRLGSQLVYEGGRRDN